MRKLLLGAISVVIVIGAWAIFIRDTGPKAEEIVALLQASNPEAAPDDIGLEGCVLYYSGEAASVETMTTVNVQVNLGLYDLETVRIVPMSDGRATYVASHVEPVEPFVQDVQRMLAHIPEQIAESFALEAEDIQALVADGGVVVRMGILIPQGGVSEAVPDEGAPAFYRFSQEVLAQTPPINVRITRSFRGDEAREDSFLSGEVLASGEMSLTVASEGAAQEFGKMFFEYQQANCQP